MKKNIYFLLLSILCILFTQSCKDEIDKSDYATFTGETVTSFLQNDDNMSKFSYILTRVKLSKYSESSLSQLLSTRGNYTVFAPNNDAVQMYIDSIYATPNYDITLISDSVAGVIAQNCIIDNGSDDAYKTSDFTVGAIEKTSINNRYITVTYDTITGGKTIILLNNTSRILSANNEVSNGVVHKINRVLSPSTAMLPALIAKTENLKIFSKLLEVTGYDNKMQKYRDTEYEDWALLNPTGPSINGGTVPVPAYHNTGYTAFVETDDVFENKWGIPAPQVVNGLVSNYDDIIAAVYQKCKEAYPDATSDNFKDSTNALNQFISYHLLPMRITYNKLVIHHVEMGYSYNLPDNLTINCYEYYETMGSPRRLMKLTEGATTDGKRINRYSTYNDADYSELTVPRPGIKILGDNGSNEYNALNGFYYPIDDILVYDDDVPNKVLNERIRIDMCAIFPEVMTNGIRCDGRDKFYHCYLRNDYIANLTIHNEDTYNNYKNLRGNSIPIGDWQNDEFSMKGPYDFTIKLPPVPYTGTWELRWCVPTLAERGMAQLYFGTNENNLPAIGLPVDFRLLPVNYGWEPWSDDDETNAQTARTLRNKGYMIPPFHDGMDAFGSAVTVPLAKGRNQTTGEGLHMRRIIYSGVMDHTKTYYLRIKSVMENSALLFTMDYLEYAPKHVFNGTNAEDRW